MCSFLYYPSTPPSCLVIADGQTKTALMDHTHEFDALITAFDHDPKDEADTLFEEQELPPNNADCLQRNVGVD